MMDAAITDILEAVKDPELPTLSIREMGILRHTEISENGEVKVQITPTYAGCPAMETIVHDIVSSLNQHGYNQIQVEHLLSPAWSSDWISDSAKHKLKQLGIAPPLACSCAQYHSIQCPLCNQTNTEVVSEYGSTACKAIYRCNSCHEIFDLFKSI